jgi:GAF domain-containing protein
MKRIGSLLNKTWTYALAGALLGLLFTLVAILVRMATYGLSFNLAGLAALPSSDPVLWIIATAPSILGVFSALLGRRQDALESANNKLKVREQELERTKLELEERVNERTQSLENQNMLVIERLEQLNAVADLTRTLMSLQELDRLLPTAARMIGQKFSFYHVGIYLLDEQKQHAVLLAANSKGGEQILRRGQRVKIGEQSLVEFVIRSGQPRVVSDPLADALFHPEPELAETRSTIVLPLRTGETILGAIDFHTNEIRSFTADQVSVLSILADQLAIAIQNAALHGRTQRTLREVEVNSRQLSASQWSGWVEPIQARGYRYDGIRAEPIKEVSSPAIVPAKVQDVPIRLRGRTIGHLKIKLAESAQGWTDDELAIAEATAERAALALDGARLLEEAQKRAARESFLSEIAAKLSTSFQMDSILRDTVEELGQTLHGATVSFQLINPSASPKVEATKRDDSSPDRNHSGQVS